METSKSQSMSDTAKVWALRILFCAFPLFFSVLANSSLPMWAFALAWGPNGFFLAAFMRGRLRLPRFLEPVHPLEPTIYRWTGAGLIKRIVETRTWPRMAGFEPPPKAKNRQELLDRTELSARGAEICHASTFALAALVAMICLAAGKVAAALWILAFNLLLNGYPVMLQRTHRRRIQDILGHPQWQRSVDGRAPGYPVPIQASPSGVKAPPTIDR